MNADLDWRLLRELLDLRSRFHKAVERAIAAHAAPMPSAAPFEPAVDIWEDAAQVVVEAELPGTQGSEIELRLDGDVLVISGALGPDAPPEGVLQRSERPRGTFRRTIKLPVEPAGQPTATLGHGILTVRLAKAGSRRHFVPISTEAP